MKQVFIFLATGFEEIEAIAPIDVLRRAELNVITVSISESRKVEGAHGIKVEADQLFSETKFGENDYYILPGGLDGMLNLSSHEGVNELLKKQHSEGKQLAAICASPSVLGKLGILEGKEAVCYPGFEENLKGATISKLPVVEDGNVITGKGPGVAIEFALKIVETLKGKEVADEVAAGMMI
ncbi:MAG: DJ-1 family protein [Porphyromonadaceae bacterium]|jgi:4-methyl-5(b-hydroxyethyl)-thiazole monophosphate biosynthesis|nr:DJ-1 family protein [Porphyromonadaceae bacterium]